MQPQKRRMLAQGQQDFATDERGRRRFHGAFSGGFSAGHFNTVGSAEGWTPQSFVSSRSSRAEQKQQSTRDFMDDEDGLLGGQLQAKEEYDTFNSATLKRLEKVAELAAAGGEGGVIPGPMPGELISVAPTARPIGYKLLQQMGWREGQAIGRRKKRSMVKPNGTTASAKSSIGLLIPEGVDLSKLPSQAFGDDKVSEREEDGNERVLSDVTYAPRNTDIPSAQRQKPVPKFDSYGLGYDPSAVMSGQGSGRSDMLALQASRNKFKQSETQGTGRYCTDNLRQNSSTLTLSGRTGSVKTIDQGGFALFDDEDDVYDDDVRLDTHNRTEVESTNRSSNFHALSSEGLFRIKDATQSSNSDVFIDPSYQSKSFYLTDGTGSERIRQNGECNDLALPAERCRTDNKPPLMGFRVGKTVTLFTTDRYPLPSVPSDFKEFHVFPAIEKLNLSGGKASDYVDKSRVEQLASSSAATDLLVGSGAVYEMLDDRGKEQYNQALRRKFAMQNNKEGSSDLLDHLKQQETAERRQLKQTAFSKGLGDALRSRFTSSSSSGKSVDDATGPSQSAKLGLSSTFQSSASGKNSPSMGGAGMDKNNANKRVIPSKGLRSSTSWEPARLLCKRMNVPVPSASNSLQQVSDVIGGPPNATISKREDELYEANVGKYLSNIPRHDGKGAGKESTSQQGQEKMLTVVSEVTGDFELVSKEKFISEKSSGKMFKKLSSPQALVPPPSRSTTQGIEISSPSTVVSNMPENVVNSGSSDDADVRKHDEMSPPNAASEPAVIPSLSLFQSIFCPSSDDDSESDDDSDDESNGSGDEEMDERISSIENSSDGKKQEISENASLVKEVDEVIGIEKQSEAKIVFSKPQSSRKTFGVSGAARKRRHRAALLSFDDDASENAESEGIIDRKENYASDTPKKRMKKTDLGNSENEDATGSITFDNERKLLSSNQTSTMSLIQKLQHSLDSDSKIRRHHTTETVDSSSSGDINSSDNERKSKKHKHKSKKSKHKSKKKNSNHKSSKKKRKKDER